MVSATPRISNATLSGMLRGGRFSLGNRIVLSFGALFVLMVIMAAVSYTRLRAIDEEAMSLERDSVPGLYLSTSLRAATRNSQAMLERALFVDTDADAVRRDLDRAAKSVRELDQYSTAYEATIFREDDRQRFGVYRAAIDKYLAMFNDAVQQAAKSRPAAQVVAQRAIPAWEEAVKVAEQLVTDNRAAADQSAQQIRSSVQSTEVTLAVALGVVLLAALVLGYALFKAITVPMARVVDAHDDMRTGNLSGRLDLRRNDEFGTLEEGFNRMAEELASLVSQAQKSSLQVTTSVAEITATSK